ncbi:nicotinamide-nucleotide amidase [Variovorax sp. OK605]|uniref:CinA family protein n=1 Tax=Variovorax sp. OK605 TaxID=1855317 RepID=UPI0008E33205|nr:CinA family protein [Variovorax sp. OK605]SFP07772.1 nicotinamide-nucleotide amidase [Variovorax sp. OK605]
MASFSTTPSTPPATTPSTSAASPALADLDTPDLVAALAALLQRKGWMLATAESCTGGLIGAACTELAGSSVWFERGFITYSNEAKTQLLGVDAATIAAHGAVSEPVARAMATGAIAHSAPSRVALAVTGVAGPTGGTSEKPVGTVWFGWSVDGDVRTERRRFDGDRATVRAATVRHALQTLVELLGR